MNVEFIWRGSTIVRLLLLTVGTPRVYSVVMRSGLVSLHGYAGVVVRTDVGAYHVETGS